MDRSATRGGPPPFRPVAVALPGHRAVARSLRPGDRGALAAFLTGLGSASRRFWHGDEDPLRLAAEHCAAIDRYDKLRLVADRRGELVALFELSFAIPDADHCRFEGYGVRLDEATDVRLGPCVADGERGTGLADRMLDVAAGVAADYGRTRLLLWGGVHDDNARALAFYRRHGFVEVGRTAEGKVDMLRPGHG